MASLARPGQTRKSIGVEGLFCAATAFFVLLADMSDLGAPLDEVMSNDSGSGSSPTTQNSSSDSLETSASTAPSLNSDSGDPAPPQDRRGHADEHELGHEPRHKPEHERADLDGNERASVANERPRSNVRPAVRVDRSQSGDDQVSTTETRRSIERTNSRSEVTLTFLTGWLGPEWRKTLVVHCVLALIFNGLALSIGIYSAFWGDSGVQQRMSNMQKVITDKLDDNSNQMPSNQTLEQLLALEKWNSFNTWIQSCATYAKMDIESGRCKGALESFDQPPPYLPSDCVQSLGKRNLDEIAQSLRSAIGANTTFPYYSQPSHVNRVHLILLGSTCAVLSLALCFLLFQARIAKLIPIWLRTDRKSRLIPFNEKSEADFISGTAPVGVGISFSPKNTETTVRRRRVENSRQLQATNIWYAASQGDAGAVEGFLLRGECPDINATDGRLGSPLHAAAQSGNDRLVSLLLRKGADANLTGGQYHSPLQAAAYSTNPTSVEILLRHGARVDAYGGVFGSPLHAAAERGPAGMVASLLADHNADPNMRGGPSSLPLHAAAYRGNEEIAKILLERGADINASGEQFPSALHAAVMGNQRSVAKQLLNVGAQVNAPSESHGTPLQIACRQENGAALALLLVQHGANVKIISQDKQTPLHFAAKSGHQDLARELLAQGMDPDAPDDNGWTPLHFASLNGHAGIAQLLLDHNANVTAEDKFKAHPLFRSAGQHHTRVTSLLLEAGSPPDARDCFGRTALHGPAADEDVSVQEMLIAKGADINIVGEDKKTPLHEAANVGNYANVELLLKQEGIITSLQDNDQKTPLHRALDHVGEAPQGETDESDHDRIALLLLKAPDLDINARSGLALQEAIARNRPKLVNEMLDRKASVHLLGGKYGGTVQAAVRSGNIAILAQILGKGANINACGGEYGSALQAAAFFGQNDMVDLLLEYGANVNAKGGRWGSTLHAARTSQAPVAVKEEIVRSLKNHRALEEPPQTLENEEWTLTAGGWTWVKPDPWSGTQSKID